MVAQFLHLKTIVYQFFSSLSFRRVLGFFFLPKTMPNKWCLKEVGGIPNLRDAVLIFMPSSVIASNACWSCALVQFHVFLIAALPWMPCTPSWLSGTSSLPSWVSILMFSPSSPLLEVPCMPCVLMVVALLKFYLMSPPLPPTALLWPLWWPSCALELKCKVGWKFLYLALAPCCVLACSPQILDYPLDSGHNITLMHQIVFLAQNPGYFQIPPSSPLFLLLMHLKLL